VPLLASWRVLYRGAVGRDRPLDVVVFGATGFVGRLAAAYLAEHAPPGVRVGLAGRSEVKLAEIRSWLGEVAADWALVVAEAGDRASLDAMARGAGVVATTVGPYRHSGLPLVEACADAGTHYADLTGEVLFVHETMNLHERAAASGARIVHSCGFDSIPSDLGVYLLHQTASEDGAGELEDTTLVVTAMRGGVSGGTLASMKGQIDDVKASGAARRTIGDPYALVPGGAPDPRGPRERDASGVSRDEALGQWVGPFVMAPYNTRIVRRSNALQDWAYGRRFRYREVTALGNGPVAPAKGLALAGGLGALAAGLAFPFTRRALDRVLPGPGEGPSEESRRKGFFQMEIHTLTSSGARYVAKVASKGDPGYAATAVMMGESALCLSLDGERLPRLAGVLTPASAMDGALVERLREAGMTLDVERT
jgi:short subunit dehydrogenase-like uncharacterized protein